MSDLFGNHVIGFLMSRLKYLYPYWLSRDNGQLRTTNTDEIQDLGIKAIGCNHLSGNNLSWIILICGKLFPSFDSSFMFHNLFVNADYVETFVFRMFQYVTRSGGL